MGDSTPTPPAEDKSEKSDNQTPKNQGGNEVIPLAAAAFLGGLAGALVGSAIS